MKNITEIEREIISAQKELAELDARKSALLEMIKKLQEERDLIDKASTSSSQGQGLEKFYIAGAVGSKAPYEHNGFAVLNLLVSCFRTNVLRPVLLFGHILLLLS